MSEKPNQKLIEGRNFRGLRPPVPGEESQEKEVIERATYSTVEPHSSYLRRSLSLSHLLEDKYGVELFKKFVEEDNAEYANILNFYFACEGLKQQSNPETVRQTIGAIYRFLRRSKLPVTENLRNDIKANLREEIFPNPYIFNALQANVEKTIRETLYPKFLKSDKFCTYIKTLKNHQGSSDVKHNVAYSPSLWANISDSERSIDTLQNTSLKTFFKSRDVDGIVEPISEQCVPFEHSPKRFTNEKLQRTLFDRFRGDGFQYVKKYHKTLECIELDENIIVNKETNAFQVIPRTKRMDSIHHRPLKEEELLQLLIPKLEEIKLKEDLQTWTKKLNFEDNRNSSPKQRDRKLSGVIQNQSFSSNETDQDILDQHVSRVWRDITPIQSPTSPSRQVIRSKNKGPAIEVKSVPSNDAHKIKQHICHLERSPSLNIFPGKRLSKNSDEFSERFQNFCCASNKYNRGTITHPYLKEGKRRLENEDQSSRKPSNQRIVDTSPYFISEKVVPAANTNSTTAIFCFYDEQFPYRTKIPNENPTLKQFKDFLPKHGSFRFFFKTHCDDPENPIIHEEIVNDNDILPKYEGKILGLVKTFN